MRIYIASPYSADTLEQMESNVQIQIDAGIQLMQMGHCPFIPLLSHYTDLRAKEKNIDISYETWMSWDLHWLSQCNAVLLLGESKGGLREKKHAEELGLPVYYSVDEIKDLTEERN